MGLHTGEPTLTEEGYVGLDVHKAARIAAWGLGGQVLLSEQTARLVEQAALRDLGEHRLKDLSAPDRIFQLGDGDFPPLKTLYRTNLPIPATVRVGGTGKTRLALQSAAALADHYPNGVWWVPLASLSDPQLVLEQAARTLESKNGLAEHISDKRLLCLFDNFEHVTEAAPGLGDLLATCPNLLLLVTSREPLRLSGEREYAVPSLADEEGVALFRERATSAEPAETVLAICRRLDCLPLVELAAARTKALSTEQILERLEQRLPLLTGGPRDAPERQRTLRATIEWSHDLLDDDERRLFRRLAVFTGGCTLEAAEKVAQADLDTLQSLVEKSLVRHTGERSWMLETIREYATERLEESGEAEDLRRRHAEFFLWLADSANVRSDRSNQRPELVRGDLDNFRAAMAWASSVHRDELALRIATALEMFWVYTNPAEAVRWLQSLLEDARDVPPKLLADALSVCGSVATRPATTCWQSSCTNRAWPSTKRSVTAVGSQSSS
jgi:predicted ATPase